MTNANVETKEYSEIHMNEILALNALDNINEAMMFTNKHHQIIHVNQQFKSITGLTMEDCVGKTPHQCTRKSKELRFYHELIDHVEVNQYWQGEYLIENDDRFLVQSVTIERQEGKGEGSPYYVVNFTYLMEHEKSIHHYIANSSYYDSLTSLPNRSFFEKRIINFVEQLNQTSESFTVVFFQLENFTEINQTYNLFFGDAVLRRIASRLNQQTSNHFMITRWSGVEFACILKNVSNKNDIHDKIKYLEKQITTPILVNGIEITLAVKFGVHTYRDKQVDVSTFLAQANAALKMAKERDLAIQFYDDSMKYSDHLFIMELALQKAIEQDQFELYYQPLVCADNGRLNGFEGLIRWHHPKEGVISPIKFIPLAEQTGFIDDIGYLVFEKACKQVVEWRRKGHKDFKIHINLSMSQLKSEELVNRFKKIMDETKVSPDSIGIELTETALSLELEDSIKKLNQLKDLGLSIAIDDFGTGYTSFGYLIDFPIKRIKIDRSYINALDNNEKIAAIVTAISQMGQTMDLEVVAEGIETEKQLAQVKALKCSILQGYLFDKPLPKKEIEEKWLL